MMPEKDRRTSLARYVVRDGPVEVATLTEAWGWQDAERLVTLMANLSGRELWLYTNDEANTAGRRIRGWGAASGFPPLTAKGSSVTL